jgi:RNA methyltransferase, TrmH family
MASRRDDAPVLTTTSGRVRTARRLARRGARARTGLFLAEGPQAVREALAEPGRVREVFALSGAHPELEALAHDRAVPWQPSDEQAIASLSDTVTPQGVVAVCRAVDTTLAEVVALRPRLVAVCVDVRDPGNAGTIVRCADAAGADAVVLAGDSVDVHNAKVVRASAGSVFHLPVAVHRDVAAVLGGLRESGVRTLAADGRADLDLDDALDTGVLAGPTAWVFGNEAHGLDEGVRSLADGAVRIPVHGRAESLNLATAAAVCLYASARAQRVAVRGEAPTDG